MPDVEKTKKSRKISVWNWIGTLILMMIPGVNLISAILFLCLSKVQAKRSFCAACLILMTVWIVLICVAFLFMPDVLTYVSNQLRGAASVDSMVFLP